MSCDRCQNDRVYCLGLNLKFLSFSYINKIENNTGRNRGSERNWKWMEGIQSDDLIYIYVFIHMDSRWNTFDIMFLWKLQMFSSNSDGSLRKYTNVIEIYWLPNKKMVLKTQHHRFMRYKTYAYAQICRHICHINAMFRVKQFVGHKIIMACVIHEVVEPFRVESTMQRGAKREEQPQQRQQQQQ